MSGDEVIEGSGIQPPRPAGDAAVLAAFREVTGWTDEDVLHYAGCLLCDPCGADLEYYCRDSPRKQHRSPRAASLPPRNPDEHDGDQAHG